eukprot:1665842-Alexandrium_andersonii.AAC.1
MLSGPNPFGPHPRLLARQGALRQRMGEIAIQMAAPAARARLIQARPVATLLVPATARCQICQRRTRSTWSFAHPATPA